MTPEQWQIWADRATVLAAIGGLIALKFVFMQLRYQARQHKKEYSVQFAQRYTDMEFIKQSVTGMDFVRSATDKNQDDKFTEYKKDKDILTSVRLTLNYFEGLAYMYINSLVDRDIIDELIGVASINSYKNIEWLIMKIHEDIESKNKEINKNDLPYTLWAAMNKLIKERKTKPKLPFLPTA